MMAGPSRSSSGSIGGETRSWRKSERRKAGNDQRRVLGAIARARGVIPDYAVGRPVTTGDVRRLAGAVSLKVTRAADEMDSPAVLTPPINGHYRLIVAPRLQPQVVRHVTLHEIGHVLMGDIDEPTFMTWAGPLPEAEDQADLFSLVGLLDEFELQQGAEFVEARIRELVPLDNYGWQTYRVPRLARKVVGLAGALAELPGTRDPRNAEETL